jgi:hypothetical protein
MTENAVIEKPTKHVNLDEKEFLLLTQSGPKGSVLDVKPLWDNYFRLNFWKEITENEALMPRNEIVESRFVKVIPDGKAFKVINLTKTDKEDYLK